MRMHMQQISSFALVFGVAKLTETGLKFINSLGTTNLEMKTRCFRLIHCQLCHDAPHSSRQTALSAEWLLLLPSRLVFLTLPLPTLARGGGVKSVYFKADFS